MGANVSMVSQLFGPKINSFVNDFFFPKFFYAVEQVFGARFMMFAYPL